MQGFFVSSSHRTVVAGSQAYSLLFAGTSCQTGSVGVGRTPPGTTDVPYGTIKVVARI